MSTGGVLEVCYGGVLESDADMISMALSTHTMTLIPMADLACSVTKFRCAVCDSPRDRRYFSASAKLLPMPQQVRVLKLPAAGFKPVGPKPLQRSPIRQDRMVFCR